MWVEKPAGDAVMDRGSVIRFLEIAEKTLTDLVQDRKLPRDLQTVARLTAASPDVPPKETAEFRKFLDRFLGCERALLLQSGMIEAAATEILSDLEAIAEAIREPVLDVYGLQAKLNLVTERIRAARNKELVIIQRETLGKNVWRVVKGCALLGIDGGSIYIANLIVPILGGVISAGPAALSIKVGISIASEGAKEII